MTQITIHGREIEPPARPRAATGPLSIGVHGGILHEAPAVLRRDWLPENATPELEELREQHHRLLDRVGEVAADLAEAEDRFEAESAEHAEALRAHARGEEVEIPSLTPPEERAAVIAALNADAQAVREVLEQFVLGAVADITDNYEDWTTGLDEEDALAQSRVEEAQRALAEAEASLGSRAQLRVWLNRSAGRHPVFRTLDARHISYGDLVGVGGFSTQVPEPSPDRAEPAAVEPAGRGLTPEARALQLAERANRFNGTPTPKEDQ